MSKNKANEILKKYQAKLSERIQLEDKSPASREYNIFRKEAIGKLGFYEKICGLSERIVKIKPNRQSEEKLVKSIEMGHLEINPAGALSFAVLLGGLVVLIGLIYLLVIYYATAELKLFLPGVLILTGAILILLLSKFPNYLAGRWRLRASNQMVPCILYAVMYMRHTPNMEHALRFSAEHITEPLSLDLRKVLWDVETARFSTLKDSLDYYLQGWRAWNLEFIEAFHLIEGSLYEPDEARRMGLLERALNVMLEGTYEKMMHFAHGLKNPITMLYMLGVVLPILGLVIFPLVGSFLGGVIKWWHLSILYNFILPGIVLFIGWDIFEKRPTGYGESGYKIEPAGGKAGAALVIGLLFVVMGLTPLIIHLFNSEYDISLGLFGKFLNYSDGGPYGIIAMFFSFLIPLGVALGLALFYRLRTKGVIGMRIKTKALEREFAESLFQLGNRIEDGLPTELAFEAVGKTMSGTPTGDFFMLVSGNIRRLGMGIQEAIFSRKVGAILSFPSAIIEGSMKILVEGSRKGGRIVAQSMRSISEHINRIYKVNERLNDLLADILSSMKSQINFLTPVIAGIVVGIASMIVAIIGKLNEQFTEFVAGDVEVPINLANFVNIFELKGTIPPFYFQLVVGLYVIEVIFILSVLANWIENGADKLSGEHALGKNLLLGTLVYLAVALIVTVVFTLLASGILQTTWQV